MKTETSKSLKSFNTFGIPATAAYYLAVEESCLLGSFLGSGQTERTRILVLGGGSNLLFTGDFDGLVIHMLNKGIETVTEDKDDVVVRVQAGELWDDFVTWCTDRQLYGVENLVAIPGSVGAAPVQNIGAYGAEVKDVLMSVDFRTLPEGDARSFSAEACRFGYRTSIFKGELREKAIITSVVFRLKKHGKVHTGYGDVQQMLDNEGIAAPKPADVARVIRSIRSAKLPDPAVTGNAGSFFKNPVVDQQVASALREKFPDIPCWSQPDGRVKLAAGWMIEQCGLKGFSIGGAAVHDRQALVLVNLGGATGQQVVALAAHVTGTVWGAFGVRLEPEVNIL